MRILKICPAHNWFGLIFQLFIRQYLARFLSSSMKNICSLRDQTSDIYGGEEKEKVTFIHHLLIIILCNNAYACLKHFFIEVNSKVHNVISKIFLAF